MSTIEIFRDFFVMIGNIWGVVATAWFIVLPVVFYYLFKILWMDYVIDGFWGRTPWVLLEIIPPREIEKSPQPMEMIYSGLLGSMGGINIVEQYVDGKSPLYFSLELESNEGRLHFYVRAPRSMRGLVEAHVYAQYPDAQVLEAQDYTQSVPVIVPNKNWNLWGTDFILDKPDAYPIKGYPWFEESVTGKMLDPMAGLIESMGRIGAGERIWLQLLITPKDFADYETGRELVDKIAGRAKPKSPGVFEMIFGDLSDVIGGVFKGFFGTVEFEQKKDSQKDAIPVEFKLTPGEREVLKVVESGLGKSTFQTKYRFVYLGKRENFDRVSVSSIVGSIKGFSDINLNGFKPDNTSKTFAIHLFADARMLYRQRKLFRRYKERSRDGKQFVLNTEELATIFHFPDMGVISPAVQRVETRTGSAPANLPIEIL